MQYFLDHCERDIKLTSGGDILMTARDLEQNAVGDCIVHLDDDMFDLDFGIDFKTLRSLGNSDFALNFLRSEVYSKFEKQNIEVQNISITSPVPPIYNVIVSFFVGEQLEQIEINSII